MMKICIAAATTSFLVLSGCQSATKATAEKPGAVEPSGASAAAPFVGKQLVSDNGTVFLFKADGGVSGTLRGTPIIGTYTATASEICSTYTSPERLTGREYCSAPAIDGDMVVFNRRDGSQSQPYRIVTGS